MRFTREKQVTEPYRCKDCGKYFWRTDELANHVSAEHDLTEDNSFTTEDTFRRKASAAERRAH
jgi:hypothetical protein